MTPQSPKLKTLRRIHVPDAIYFVTGSTQRKVAILRGDAAREVSDAFQRARREGRASMLAYVVMPDHVHAIVQPAEDATIGKVMAFVKRTSANCMRHNGHVGRVWEERFYDRVIRTEAELRNAVSYIHQNPMKAGLCDRAQEWPWSTAHPSVASDLDLVVGRWNAAAPLPPWSPEDSEMEAHL